MRRSPQVWKKDRGIDFGTTDGDAKKAYSTPLLIKDGGRELLISPFAAATIAYDPKTGEPVYMDDVQRAAAIENERKSIAAFCK